VDASLCREHLEKLLIEENDALTRLTQLLAVEHETIVANDVDALERTGTARQSCVGDLLRIEEERRSLCRMLNFAADPDGLDALLKWCDPKMSVRKRWQECLTLATQCRDLNERNGMLVAARLKRVEGLLSVVTGRSKEKNLYSAKGRQVSFSSGNVFAQA
jgi:flagellar biosynthesis/type III secretory pathway chaperone